MAGYEEAQRREREPHARDGTPQATPADLSGPGGLAAMAQSAELNALTATPAGPPAASGDPLARTAPRARGAQAEPRAARGETGDAAHQHAEVDPAARGAAAALPTTKAAALTRHARNRRVMRSIIDAGLAQQIDPALGHRSRKNLWRNAAEWLSRGQARLFVLSPIHDSTARPGINNGQIGYFDTRVDNSTDGATYADDVNDLNGIRPGSPHLLGSMSGDGQSLTVVDPQKQSEALLVETLIHEVQHDADQHGGAFAPTPPPGATAPAWAFQGYETEFRAYWLENPEGSTADAWPPSTDPVGAELTVTARDPGPDGVFGGADDVLLGTATTSLKNARQEAILRHLVSPDRPAGDWWANNTWTQSYAYVAYYMATDPTFLQMVNDLDRPVAGNALNSIRIQALSEAVAAHDLHAIINACVALDTADREYLKDKATAHPFWDQVDRELGDPARLPMRIIVESAIASGDAPDPAVDGGSYVVVAGDTLSRIAERALGGSTRHGEILALNRDKIRDAGHIEPGWVLRLPPP